jgi:hypothetical protein
MTNRMSSKGRSIKLKNGLTAKQDAFKRTIIKQIATTGTPNATQAALATYDTTDPNTANSIASENLANPIIRSEIEAALSRVGMSLDKTLKNIQGLAESAPEKITGETVLKANLSILKLLGHDGSKKQGSSLNVNQININLGYDEAKSKLQALTTQAEDFITEAESL